jgi:hypothetical protein
MDGKVKLAILLVALGIIAVAYGYVSKEEKLSDEDLVKVSYGESIQITAAFLNPKYPELKLTSFYLRLDTHSGDLYQYDLLNLTVLEVGGKRFSPLTWKEEGGSWGHHRMGVMEFPEEAMKDIKRLRTFRLVISGIEGTRILEWRV